MDLKTINNKYYNFIIEFSSFIVMSTIYISGIGRYRIVIVYAVYTLIISIICLIKKQKLNNLPLLPFAIIAVYFDIINGPLLPIYDSNYLSLVILLIIVSDEIIRRFIKNIISRISNYELFVVCPSCRFNNKNIVKKCSNCSYCRFSDTKLSKQIVEISKHKNKVFNFIQLKND